MSILVPTSDKSQITQPQDSAGTPHDAAPHTARIVDLAVLVTGAPEDDVGIAYADSIASAFDGHMDVYLANHIPLPPLPMGPGSDAIAGMIVQKARTSGDEVEKRLRERLVRVSPPYELRRDDGLIGYLVTRIAALAGSCDLFVMAQDVSKSAAGKELLEAILFKAGSGVILVPTGLSPDAGMPKTILVGWRDTPECAHAIRAALPFLQRAQTVVLASVAEEGSSEQRGVEPMSDMARHLARHGVRVETRELPQWKRAWEGLAHEAEAIGADMIVIGAYGHSRVREFFLGGVTRAMLAEGSVPILLAH
ncbi:universal stress protein [Fulvimarina sp. 2208YS6-2-32]|uniref:Universal stress protein n=1 Tax=Fulvimarina uroteuthidis TaxID=3098149 RepID=A0ABU5I541_9HYPH|nr:universal stress protein [Fulvimarina sp. 2208YS6-2-32]MDY8110215.1 universal stress protein [Fulvimarina sp. 2208YS6-2-32]